MVKYPLVTCQMNQNPYTVKGKPRPNSFPHKARLIGVLLYRNKIWNQVRVHDERLRQDKGQMGSTKFNRSGFLTTRYFQ